MLCDTHEILPVAILQKRLCEILQLGRVNISHAIGYFLNAGDPQPLALLNDAYKIGSLHQSFMRARIEPCNAPAQFLHG